MDFDYLKASDGNGDAALMHITEDRLEGSTTLKVDSVVNVPNKFIGTAGPLLANGFIDPNNKTEFKGHLEDEDIIIDSFEAGSEDSGNVSGQVVTIRPTTGWANMIAEALSKLYPVGSVYINANVATNPATLLGFGTWVAYGAGRTLIGVGSSDQTFDAEDTGGESEHQLTLGEIPSHQHRQAVDNSYNVEGGGNPGRYADNNTGNNRSIAGMLSGSAGSDQAHNNLPPYIVAYIWVRTA